MGIVVMVFGGFDFDIGYPGVKRENIRIDMMRCLNGE